VALAPLDSLVLYRWEHISRKKVGSVRPFYSALNMHLRQNLGIKQQDIKNLISEMQESFELYPATSQPQLPGWE
jgi:hypothetical protein